MFKVVKRAPWGHRHDKAAKRDLHGGHSDKQSGHWVRNVGYNKMERIKLAIKPALSSGSILVPNSLEYRHNICRKDFSLNIEGLVVLSINWLGEYRGFREDSLNFKLRGVQRIDYKETFWIYYLKPHV